MADILPWLDELSAGNSYAGYARLRADDSVCLMTSPGGIPVWLVTRYDEALSALSGPQLRKDPAVAEAFWLRHSVDAAAAARMCLVPTMLAADPPRHARLRSAVTGALSARRVQQFAPLVQRVVRRQLAAVAEAREFCVLSSLADVVPMEVMTRLIGVPESDAVNFQGWARTVITRNFDRPDAESGETGPPVAALLDLMGYLAALAVYRRRVPGDDLVTFLVQQGEERIDDIDILATLLLLLVAGHETTSNLIGNTVLALLQNPAQRRLLEADLSLAGAAVEEGARYYSPVATASWRFTAADLPLGKCLVPAGEPVRVLIGSANRDERTFEDADKFDITRPRPPHVGFGFGPHFCLGAPLARLEATAVTSELFAAFPGLELAAPGGQVCWVPGHIMRGLTRLPVRRTHEG